MSSFDPNTWYSIIYTKDAGQSALGNQVKIPTSVYLYPTNTSAANQRWQIFPAALSTPSNPVYLLRSATIPAVYYLKSYCASLSDCPMGTWSGTGWAYAINDVMENEMWTVADSGAGDGSYHITNYANGTGYYLDAKSSTIWMNPNLSDSGLKWTFSGVTAIDDSRFSTTLPVSSQQSATLASTVTVTAQMPTLSSVNSTQATPTTTTSPSSSGASSSGMSSGTKAGIGGGAAGVIMILLLAAFVFILMRRRKRRRPQLTGTRGSDDRQARKLQGEWSKAEMHGNSNVSRSLGQQAEMGAGDRGGFAQRVELESKHNKWPSELAVESTGR